MLIFNTWFSVELKWRPVDINYGQDPRNERIFCTVCKNEDKM